MEKREKVDLLKVAKKFGTKVLSLEELKVQLRKFKPFPPAQRDDRKKKEELCKGTCRTIISPTFMGWVGVYVLIVHAGGGTFLSQTQVLIVVLGD